ncbi:hypothetical protein HNY73_020504 [Argiope bruennichi]|uniref:Spidroin N-terminal domain-containing protein n=1 Tax=Argiope bruennichi TaxID=94029 RepID=A0A8T0E8B5_ARGBR|nr:hypothetical protein HNY73_020504 [Argiope bruennichi]
MGAISPQGHPLFTSCVIRSIPLAFPAFPENERKKDQRLDSGISHSPAGIYSEIVRSAESYDEYEEYEYDQSSSQQNSYEQSSENEPNLSFPQQNANGRDSENEPGQSSSEQNIEGGDSENESGQSFPQQNANGQNYQPGQNFPQQDTSGQSYQPGENYPQQDTSGQSYQPGENYPQPNANGQNYQPGQNYPQQNANGQNYQPGQNYPHYNANGHNYQPGQNYPQYNGNGHNYQPGQNYPQYNGNGQNFQPGQHYPQYNGNGQNYQPGQHYPQQNDNGQNSDDYENDPLGFNELGDQFANIFVQNILNNPHFGKGADTDFSEVTYALTDAINLLRQAHHALPEQKRTIMIAFAATIAELIVIECRDTLSIFQKVEIVTNALKTAYEQTTGRINYPLINEVTFLVIIFLEETSQKPPVDVHELFPGFPGLIFLPKTFQPKFTYDPRLISYIYGQPDDFTFDIPTKNGIPQEKVPGQNYTVYFPFLRRFIEEVENIYPLYPYHTMPESEYQLLFPQLYRLKPRNYNYTIYRRGSNPYEVLHRHPGKKIRREVEHKHHRRIKHRHHRPGEPSSESSSIYIPIEEEKTTPATGTTTGSGLTIPGIGTAPGTSTTPIKGEKTTTPGIGTTPGESQETTGPETGTTPVFGKRTPTSGERVHLHKHKIRIRRKHHRPGEPSYVEQHELWLKYNSRKDTEKHTPGTGTSPGEGQSTPGTGTSPGKGQTTPGIGTGTTPIEGQKTTIPGMETTPGQGTTVPGIGTTSSEGGKTTLPGVGTTPGEVRKPQDLEWYYSWKVRKQPLLESELHQEKVRKQLDLKLEQHRYSYYYTTSGEETTTTPSGLITSPGGTTYFGPTPKTSVPGTEGTTPSSGEITTPGTGSTPEKGRTTPGTGTSPGEGQNTPGTGNSPGKGQTTPGIGTGTTPIEGQKTTIPGMETTPGQGTTVPGIGTTSSEGGKTTLPGVGTTPGESQETTGPGTGTTPMEGEKTTAPGIGTTPGESQETTGPETGTTPVFGKRTPRSGERVHLHKHKIRIRRKHHRPGEPSYVYSYYYTTSGEETTTTPSGLITSPGGTTYFGPTPKTSVPGTEGTTPSSGEITTPGTGSTPEKGRTTPGTGTSPGEGQSTPGTGTSPEKGQTTPGIGIGTTPIEGQKTTIPGMETYPGQGTTVPGICTLLGRWKNDITWSRNYSRRSQETTGPGLVNTPMEGEKTTAPGIDTPEKDQKKTSQPGEPSYVYFIITRLLAENTTPSGLITSPGGTTYFGPTPKTSVPGTEGTTPSSGEITTPGTGSTPEKGRTTPGTGTSPGEGQSTPGTGTSPEKGQTTPGIGIGTTPIEGQKTTIPGMETTPGQGTTVPGIGTTSSEGGKTILPGVGTTPGESQETTGPGTGTTPMEGEKTTAPGIGTTPGESQKTTGPETGTTPVFGKRTPRSGERVHLHKHKIRIRRKHHRPGEPSYVYSYYYTTSGEETTTTPSGLITSPGGTTYFGPTPKTSVPGTEGTTPSSGEITTPGTGSTPEKGRKTPGTGTLPGEGQSTPGTGTSPGKGQTTPGIGTGTTPIEGQKTTIPGMETTPGQGTTVPGIGTTSSEGGKTTLPGVGTTPGESQETTGSGTGTTPMEGEKTTAPGIGTTPGESQETTGPETGTTPVFGKRTPTSGERVHLHKHKIRIRRKHHRPGEPSYVVPGTEGTTPSSGEITTPGTGSTPEKGRTTPGTGTSPGEGQSTPGTGTSPGKDQTTPGIGTGTTPIEGQKTTIPGMETTKPGETNGTTVPGENRRTVRKPQGMEILVTTPIGKVKKNTNRLLEYFGNLHQETSQETPLGHLKTGKQTHRVIQRLPVLKETPRSGERKEKEGFAQNHNKIKDRRKKPITVGPGILIINDCIMARETTTTPSGLNPSPGGHYIFRTNTQKHKCNRHGGRRNKTELGELQLPESGSTPEKRRTNSPELDFNLGARQKYSTERNFSGRRQNYSRNRNWYYTYEGQKNHYSDGTTPETRHNVHGIGTTSSEGGQKKPRIYTWRSEHSRRKVRKTTGTGTWYYSWKCEKTTAPESERQGGKTAGRITTTTPSGLITSPGELQFAPTPKKNKCTRTEGQHRTLVKLQLLELVVHMKKAEQLLESERHLELVLLQWKVRKQPLLESDYTGGKSGIGKTIGPEMRTTRPGEPSYVYSYYYTTSGEETTTTPSGIITTPGSTGYYGPTPKTTVPGTGTTQSESRQNLCLLPTGTSTTPAFSSPGYEKYTYFTTSNEETATTLMNKEKTTTNRETEMTFTPRLGKTDKITSTTPNMEQQRPNTKDKNLHTQEPELTLQSHLENKRPVQAVIQCGNPSRRNDTERRSWTDYARHRNSIHFDTRNPRANTGSPPSFLWDTPVGGTTPKGGVGQTTPGTGTQFTLTQEPGTPVFHPSFPVGNTSRRNDTERRSWTDYARHRNSIPFDTRNRSNRFNAVIQCGNTSRRNDTERRSWTDYARHRNSIHFDTRNRSNRFNAVIQWKVGELHQGGVETARQKPGQPKLGKKRGNGSRGQSPHRKKPREQGRRKGPKKQVQRRHSVWEHQGKDKPKGELDRNKRPGTGTQFTLTPGTGATGSTPSFSVGNKKNRRKTKPKRGELDNSATQEPKFTLTPGKPGQQEFTGQQPELIRLPNGDIRIVIERRRIPLYIRGPNGELIRIIEEMPGFTPGYITVKGPHGQNIELVTANSQNTPGVVTNSEGHIIRVILPYFFTKSNMTKPPMPVTVEGPHGEQILIIREHPGVTPGVVTHNGRILRIIIPKFSGEAPTYVTGPHGEIIYIIPGQNDTTPGAVTRTDGQLLYIILPQGFSYPSSTPGLVGPNIGLVNPGTTNPPSAQIGNPTIDIDTEFPDFNGTETNGTKGTGIEFIGGYNQYGPIPQNYSTPHPTFLFNTDFQPQMQLPQNYTLPPQFQNIAFEIFGNPEYNNSSPLLTLKQFDNIFAVLLKNGSPRVKQLIKVILKARGNKPKSFNLRIFVEELSRIFADMRYENKYFNYSELFIELMFETLMAALEIIRNTAALFIGVSADDPRFLAKCTRTGAAFYHSRYQDAIPNPVGPALHAHKDPKKSPDSYQTLDNN